MRLVRWPGDEPLSDGCSVVTLGVFDGVHRGHAEVIRRVVTAARQRSCSGVIVTFDRHPAAMLSGKGLPAVTSLEHRTRLFERLDVDLCVVVRFGEDVARIEAAEFARRVFHEFLRAELVILGYDCRFGRDGRGSAAVCAQVGRELGFDVQIVPAVEVDGRPVSSTDIRKAVLSGDLERAERLLGRPFSLYGTVVRGDGRGVALGYPTANLDLHDEAVPPDGVYAAWVFTDGEPHGGVVSIGRRATFHREAECARVVEVHLLDRREDLYGRDIEVEFAGRLRGQRTFRNAAALAAQIGHDVEGARRALQQRPRRT